MSFIYIILRQIKNYYIIYIVFYIFYNFSLNIPEGYFGLVNLKNDESLKYLTLNTIKLQHRGIK